MAEKGNRSKAIAWYQLSSSGMQDVFGYRACVLHHQRAIWNMISMKVYRRLLIC